MGILFEQHSFKQKKIRFRSAIKEMEVMVINVINSAFDSAVYVEHGVEILDAFMHLSAREVEIELTIH